jgi:hypothetical protein
MPSYIELDLAADAEDLRQDGRDWLTANAPAGYTIDPWIDWMLGAVARMASEVTILAGRVPIAIFQTLGQILNVAVIQATSATATARFHLNDTTADRTIEEGTQLDVDGAGFATTVDLVIPIGNSSGDVAIVALEAGAASSGLSDPVDLVSPTYVWVDSVELTAPTAGGTDGETDQEYVDRFADSIPTFSPKAINVSDAGAIARADIEVARALVLRDYIPGTPPITGAPAAGSTTVALRDAAGEPVSGASKTRVQDALSDPDERLLALAFYAIDPNYTTIDVTFTAQCYDDYTPAAVEAQAEADIADFLSPALWGVPVRGDQQLWNDEPIVRRNDLLGVLYRVPGLRHVTSLTLAVHLGVLGTADITMTGPAALPRAGTISGTVTQ